jgi:hypothetical protein
MNNGLTPQVADVYLQNSQTSQTGTFGKMMTSLLQCQKLIANVLESDNAVINSLIVNGQVTALDLKCTGLEGARNESRYVGGTVSGPPSEGTFHTGDYIVASDGHLWICIVGGEPGSWTEGGSGAFLPLAGGTMSGTINLNGNPVTNALFMSVFGVSGATATSRYVGGTVSGPPVSGSYNVGDYVISQDGNIYIYKTGGTWNQSGFGSFLPLAGGTMNGTIDMNGHEIKTALDLVVSGVTGATVTTRYVGGTVSGAPMSGTYSVGDYIVSQDGNIYIYKTPGTWNKSGSGTFLPLAGGVMNGTIDMAAHEVKGVLDLSVSGVTGATTVTKYVGGTVSGAPMSGTYSVGDYVISQDGNVYVYKTPGSWNQSGNGTFLPLAGGTMSGAIDMASHEIKGVTDFEVSGVTGANVVTRYVGGTVSGAPMSGTYQVGDYIVSQDGNIYIYKTPGTWVQSGGSFLPLAGGTMSGAINMNTNNEVKGVSDLSVSGISGATTVTRYVGGTVSGSPITGSYNVGDYIISQEGNIYIYKTGGIWNLPGLGTYLPLAGGTMSGTIDMNSNPITNALDLAVTGVSGATTASRYVGGTTSGPPTSGSFSAGDYTVSQNGNIFVQTSGSTFNAVGQMTQLVSAAGSTAIAAGVATVLVSPTGSAKTLVLPDLTASIAPTYSITFRLNLPIFGMNQNPLSIRVTTNHIYVGTANATVINGVTRNGIFRLVKPGLTLDTTWNMNCAGNVNALWDDGTNLYVGGSFTVVNGATSRGRICRVLLSSTTGTVDSTWNMNSGNTISALWGDSTNLYVGGIFTTVNGSTTRNRICRCLLSSTTGTVDSWNLNTDAQVFSLWGDATNLYVGGIYNTVNGATTRNNICRVLLSSTTGTVDATWDMNCGIAQVMTIWGDSTNLYVGGTFTTVNGGTTRNRVCRCLLSSTTGTVDSWNPNCSTTVNMITGDSTYVYIGGGFTTVTSTSYPRVALFSVLLSSTTGTPTTFAPPNLGGTSVGTMCLAYDSSSGILHTGYVTGTGSPSYIPMSVNTTISTFTGTDTLNSISAAFPYVNLVSALQNPTFTYSSSTNWTANNTIYSGP